MDDLRSFNFNLNNPNIPKVRWESENERMCVYVCVGGE